VEAGGSLCACHGYADGGGLTVLSGNCRVAEWWHRGHREQRPRRAWLERVEQQHEGWPDLLGERVVDHGAGKVSLAREVTVDRVMGGRCRGASTTELIRATSVAAAGLCV
jgi:hypothetical protein